MYRLATGTHCNPLKELRPPAADSFSDSMPAEAATVFSRDKGDRRSPKSRGQQAPLRGTANPGGWQTAAPRLVVPKTYTKNKAATEGQPAATPNL